MLQQKITVPTPMLANPFRNLRTMNQFMSGLKAQADPLTAMANISKPAKHVEATIFKTNLMVFH